MYVYMCVLWFLVAQAHTCIEQHQLCPSTDRFERWQNRLRGPNPTAQSGGVSTDPGAIGVETDRFSTPPAFRLIVNLEIAVVLGGALPRVAFPVVPIGRKHQQGDVPVSAKYQSAVISHPSQSGIYAEPVLRDESPTRRYEPLVGSDCPGLTSTRKMMGFDIISSPNTLSTRFYSR